LLTPLGIGTDQSWQAICEGRNGISRIEQFDAAAFACRIAGEVKNFDPTQFIERKEIKKMGRFIQFGIAASDFALAQSGLKVDGHIVLLCTGFHKRTYPTLDSVWKNPQVTVEATQWMYDRGSRMHGVEGPSTDRPTDNVFSQHRLCRKLGISHWEWLVNLEELLGKGEFQFFGVPLKFKGGSGSPVRAFAIVND